jgi:hypothetical protein
MAAQLWPSAADGDDAITLPGDGSVESLAINDDGCGSPSRITAGRE